jgi:hypothetical protein
MDSILTKKEEELSKIGMTLPLSVINGTKPEDSGVQANINLVDNYLKKLDWKVNENSNMSYSIQGLNNYIASEISKNYWLNKIYPVNIKNAHVNGDIHIHDLNIISVYCVGWDLKDLLMEGFKGVKGKIESAPAKHFRSALGQIVNFHCTQCRVKLQEPKLFQTSIRFLPRLSDMINWISSKLNRPFKNLCLI